MKHNQSKIITLFSQISKTLAINPKKWKLKSKRISEADWGHFEVSQVHQNCFFGDSKRRNTQEQLIVLTNVFVLQRGAVARKINSGLAVNCERIFLAFPNWITRQRVRASRANNLTFEGELQCLQLICDSTVPRDVFQILSGRAQ